MRFRLVGAAAIAVAVMATGCSSDPTSDSAAVDVVGIWSVSGNGAEALVTYRTDGFYRIAPVQGDTFLTQFDFGSFEVNGSVLTYVSADQVLGCDAGDVGTYTVEQLTATTWVATAVEDECAKRLEGAPFTHEQAPD